MRFFCTILLSLFMLFICACKKTPAPYIFDPNDYKKDYVLMIGEEFQEDETGYMSVKLDEFDSRVTVYLNGNPIFSGLGADGVSLDHFIQPNINSLSVSSETNQSLKIYLLEITKGNPSTILLEDVNFTEENDFSFSTEFQAEISYKLPIYLSHNQLPHDYEVIKKEVLSIIEDIIGELHNGDYKKAKSAFESGRKIWQPFTTGDPTVSFNTSLFDEFNVTFQEYTPSVYSIMFGNSLVLVYRNDGQDLFIKSGPNTLMKNYIFAYIEEEYVIW